MTHNMDEKSGGFRSLLTFQLAQLIYDITVCFVEKYIPASSRTRDQMEQAARSGSANIAEGSLASRTNKLTEIGLTNVAKASLGELRLDYENYLRQHGYPLWTKDHPLCAEFRSLKVNKTTEFKDFIRLKADDKTCIQEFKFLTGAIDRNRLSGSTQEIPITAWLVANATIILLRNTDYLLMKQLNRLESDYHQRRQ